MKEYVEVKKSKIAGKGVFATKSFKKGEHVIHLGGTLARVKDPDSLGDQTIPLKKNGRYFLYLVQNYPCKYINHSCDPNTGFRDDRNLLALRDIQKGEEIVFDYVMCNIDGFQMDCHCGSKNCRGKMVLFEELDKRMQRKYLPYVINYIKNL